MIQIVNQANKKERKQEKKKTLRNKIGDDVIIFNLQNETALRIFVYDEKKPCEIYEEIYVGDCLPNQAKNMFSSMGEMFEFLEMNFSSLVTLREKQAIVVDLNKLKIPIKFQLPFRLNTYPFMDVVLQSLKDQNKRLQEQSQSTKVTLRETLIHHSEQIEQLNKIIRQKESQIIDLLEKTELVTSRVEQISSDLIQQKSKNAFLSQENEKLKKKILQLEQQIQSQKQKQKQIKALNMGNKSIQHFCNSKVQPDLESDYIQQLLNDKKSIVQQIYPKTQIIKKVQVSSQIIQQKQQNQNQKVVKNQQQPIKNEPVSLGKIINPFLGGLFVKAIKNSLFSQPQQQNKSAIKKENQNQYKQSKLQPNQSRFFQFLEYQPQQNIKLNLGKKLITDQDVKELIKYDWSNITYLVLSQNLITGEGFQTLFQNKWSSLKSIILSANKITDFHLQKINFNQSMPKIIIVNLHLNKLPKEMVKKLIQFQKNNKNPKFLL